MSGVFSIASHCALQYLPDCTWHVHGGCAHFLLSAMWFSFDLEKNKSFVRELGLEWLASLRSGLALSEESQHLLVERRNIVRLPAANPVPIAHDFAIDPISARVLNVVLNCVVARKCSAPSQASGNKKPRGVANECDRLAAAIHLLHEFLRFFFHSKGISVQRSARQHHCVKFISLSGRKSKVDFHVAGLVVMLHPVN